MDENRHSQTHFEPCGKIYNNFITDERQLHPTHFEPCADNDWTASHTQSQCALRYVDSTPCFLPDSVFQVQTHKKLVSTETNKFTTALGNNIQNKSKYCSFWYDNILWTQSHLKKSHLGFSSWKCTNKINILNKLIVWLSDPTSVPDRSCHNKMNILSIHFLRRLGFTGGDLCRFVCSHLILY